MICVAIEYSLFSRDYTFFSMKYFEKQYIWSFLFTCSKLNQSLKRKANRLCRYFSVNQYMVQTIKQSILCGLQFLFLLLLWQTTWSYFQYRSKPYKSHVFYFNWTRHSFHFDYNHFNPFVWGNVICNTADDDKWHDSYGLKLKDYGRIKIHAAQAHVIL